MCALTECRARPGITTSPNWDVLVVPLAGGPKNRGEMGKGKKMRDLGEGEGLTLVCWHPAGLCLHRAVSPGELPDVIFLGGVNWDSCRCKLWERAQERGLQGSRGAEDFGDVQP